MSRGRPTVGIGLPTRSAAHMRAALYARISHDALNEGLGVERQMADCRALAERRGWEVVAEHVNKHQRQHRFNQAAPGLRRPAGRGARRGGRGGGRLLQLPADPPGAEYLDLIDLHRATGVDFKTCVSGDADLSTADGRAVALTLATWDQAEAERTSERVRRQAADRAARGRPHRGRYRTIGFDEYWQVVEEEAAVVREIFERRASGESSTSIARDLNDRGLRATSASPGWPRRSSRPWGGPSTAGCASSAAR